MAEMIYTIPVNEAFEAAQADPSCGCPYCSLERMLEKNELEAILGAAMMEPDIRIRTNELGFCPRHFDTMFSMKNRLGLALILESHLDEQRRLLDKSLLRTAAADAEQTAKKLDALQHTCYVCEKVEYHFEKMLATSVYLWETEQAFRAKFAAQPYFCFTHYARLLSYAAKKMPKKLFPDFYESARTVECGYADTLREDVKWFIKKFDYRYEEEPWKNSKDAVESAIKLLR